MKVLYVSHTAQISGAEHALLTLLARLPDGVSPAVACPEGPLAEAVRELGVPVLPVSGTSASLRLHPLYTPRALADIATSAFVVRRLARHFRADLVHANSIRAGVITTLAQRAGGPLVAVHLHDRLPAGVLSTASLKVISQGVGGVLACSEYVLKQLPPGKAPGAARVVVYNPVDTETFDPDRVERGFARERLGLGPTEIAVAVVAQITPWKGQDDAVRTLSLLRDRHPGTRLLLVGSPKFVGRGTRFDNVAYSRTLEELIASLGVESEVLQLGERTDIPEILRAADVFLAPSWEEPFSLAVLEAMAMELPVIATAVGGMGEIIDGENGVLLPPREPEPWAREIESLLEQPERRGAMGQRAREAVLKLEAGRWVERVVGAYETVLESSAAATPRRPTRIQKGAPGSLRVLYVNHTSQISGAERSLLTLLGGVDSAISPIVACPPGPLDDEVRRLGLRRVPIQGTDGSLRLHPTQTPLALLSLARAALGVRRAAREHDVDLIHANSIRAGISAGMGARLSGRPALVHVRDRLPLGAVSSMTFRLLAGTATSLVSNSEYTAEGFAGVGLETLVRVLHNPVDLNRFDPDRLTREEARQRLGLESAGSVLGVVAQITPWKAQEDAIRIAHELRGADPELRLLLVGSAKFVSKGTRFDNPTYLQRLRDLTRSLGLQENVLFLGEREDVPEILRALDVLLVPSWEEPFGRAIVEAMAMCVPVVATDIGGPTEIITNGREGLLLPPREPGRWAEAVGELLERPDLREEMGRKGRERAVNSFALQGHVQEVLALYEEVLESVPTDLPAASRR